MFADRIYAARVLVTAINCTVMEDSKSKVTRAKRPPRPPRVLAVGWGADGRLGNGVEFDSLLPFQCPFPSSEHIIQVAAGSRHSLALTKEGFIYAWGCGESGQLGLGDRRRAQVTPMKVPLQMVYLKIFYKKGILNAGLERIVSIAAGGHASYALTDGGKVLYWGREWTRETAVFDHKVRLVPEFVKLAERNIRQISAGDKHVIARTDTGAVFTWGYGKHGRLGHGDMEDRKTPKLMDSLRGANVTDVAAGGAHCAVVADVKDKTWLKVLKTDDPHATTRCVLTWGCNAKGQCGIGEKINDQFKPRVVEALLDKRSSPAKVVCGLNHTICLSSYAQIYTWGEGTYGQLGTGSHHDEYSPVLVDKGFEKGLRVADIFAGDRHSMCISESTREIYSWGSGYYGQSIHADTKVRLFPQLCQPMRFARVRAVGGGSRHSIMLLDSEGADEEHMDEELRKEMVKVAAAAERPVCEVGLANAGVSFVPIKILYDCGPCRTKVCEACAYACHRGHRLDIVLERRDVICKCLSSGECAAQPPPKPAEKEEDRDADNAEAEDKELVARPRSVTPAVKVSPLKIDTL